MLPRCANQLKEFTRILHFSLPYPFPSLNWFLTAQVALISLFHITGHEIRLCPRLNRRPRPRLAARRFEKSGCRQTFTDHGLSGATTKRPALTRCLKALEHGDTLTIWKLDRLGRSVRDLLNILHDIQAQN